MQSDSNPVLEDHQPIMACYLLWYNYQVNLLKVYFTSCNFLPHKAFLECFLTWGKEGSKEGDTGNHTGREGMKMKMKNMNENREKN